MITENQLEQLCLDWFRASGYEVFAGKDIAPESDTPEREDYRQVLLTARLLDALLKINPHIPRLILEEQVIDAINRPESPLLIQNNRKFQRYLLD